MPPKSVVDGVIGEVIVEIHFNEQGTVEKMGIVRSTSAYLSESVRSAVSQWEIIPPIRDGKAVRLTAQQSFLFRLY